MNEKLMLNQKEYTLEHLLGKGKGGYSYLAHDENGHQYVVKQIHHEPCNYYEFGDKIEAELADYIKLKQCQIQIPELLEVDKENERILKQYIEGETIFDLILKDQMDQQYLEQMHKICKKVYARHINIDYFPTNFIVKKGELWYIDFECNEYSEEWNFENWGIKYWSKTKEFLDYVKKQQS